MYVEMTPGCLLDFLPEGGAGELSILANLPVPPSPAGGLPASVLTPEFSISTWASLGRDVPASNTSTWYPANLQGRKSEPSLPHPQLPAQSLESELNKYFPKAANNAVPLPICRALPKSFTQIHSAFAAIVINTELVRKLGSGVEITCPRPEGQF